MICPLGVCQDIVSCMANKKKKNRFTFKLPFENTRLILMIVFFLAAIAGYSIVAVIFEPYSAFGRMISTMLSPFYLLSNNFLAYLSERMGNYTFYTVDIWLRSAITLIIACITFCTISVFAWKTGRGYCNIICPIGTTLGIFSKLSFFKIRLDKSKCIDCKLCMKNCKSSCIDIENDRIDYSRCVSCFNCIYKCPKKGVSFSMKKILKAKEMDSPNTSKKAHRTKKDRQTEGDIARRGVLSGFFLLFISLITRKKLHAFDFDGGLAPLERKRKIARKTPIIPAGSDNIRQFTRRCTSCQLCVSVCDNQVLRPSAKLTSFMQPHMSFERGFCRPECIKCSTVCPNGAIQPITQEEKSALQIGYAVWRPELCIVLRDNVTCDLCSVRCPTAAISQIDQDPNNTRLPKIPMIDTNRCIGCGACELFCPSRPYSAIYVEGLDTHRRV
jgi:ferredoxin